MSTENFHENLEQRRAELPERFKGASEADIFLIRWLYRT